MEKRIFGIILTVIGIAGLIYAGSTLMRTSGNTYSVKSIVVYGLLGLVFFSAGIGLLRGTKDRAV